MSIPFMLRYLTVWLLWIGFIFSLPTQAQTLPPLNLDRRTNMAYMDSLSRLAWQQYNAVNKMPASCQTDTLRFQTLYYQGRLYSWWSGRRDSTRYFANELIRQAHADHNVEFEVKGILLNEYYYNNLAGNYTEALRLNYQARDILQRSKQDPNLGWRIDMNLGNLYRLAGDYPNALKSLINAQQLIAKGSGVGPLTTIGFKADIEQKMGLICSLQNKFADSENHYLAAESLLGQTDSKTNFAYVYGDLAELYIKFNHLEKALQYARKAETLWAEMNNPQPVMNCWAHLIHCYAALGNAEQVRYYSQKLFGQKNPLSSACRRAHLSLYKLHEKQSDWEKSLWHFKQYIALTDSADRNARAKELVAMQQQNKLELLDLQHKQSEQLQAERLLIVEKQGQIDRLRASVQTDALMRKAQQSEQQRLLDAERSANTLSRQQTQQAMQQQAFLHRTEQQRQRYLLQGQAEQRTRSWLFGGLLGTLAFTLLLGLLYRRNQVQKQQIEALNNGLEMTVRARTAQLQTANEALHAKNQAIEEALLHGQTEERRRVAAELHDMLGGTLAAVKLTLHSLDQSGMNSREQPIYNQLLTMVSDASQQLRQLSHNLLPDNLQRTGLLSTLQNMLTQLSQTSPVQFDLVVDANDLPPLDKQTQFTLYAICLELCHNTLKHAGATQASIELFRQGQTVQLLMSDNGRGFAIGQAQDGMGLKNLRDRADSIGASLKIFSPEEGGTLVQLQIPIGQEQTVLELA